MEDDKDPKRPKPIVEEIVSPDEKPQSSLEEPVSEELGEGTDSIGKARSQPDVDVGEAEVVSKIKKEQAQAPELEEEVSQEDLATPPPTGGDEEAEVETEKPEKRRNIKLIVAIVIITALFVVVLVGGVYVYKTGTEGLGGGGQGQEGTEETQEVSTPTPAPSPTPAEEKEVDFSELKIQILNGSGIIGAAGIAEDLLTESEIEVSNVGNAESYDYEKTVIQAKGGVSAAHVAKLKELLSSDYEVEVGDALDDASNYDIVITIGSK